MQIRKSCTVGSHIHPEARVKVLLLLTQSAMFQDSSCRCLIYQQASTSGTSETDHCYWATNTQTLFSFHNFCFVNCHNLQNHISGCASFSHTLRRHTHTIKNVMSDITCTTATILTKPNPNLNLKTSNTPLKLWHPAKWSTSQTWHHFASRRVFWCSICSKCGHTHTIFIGSWAPCPVARPTLGGH